MLAAESHGLRTSPMEGYDSRRLSAALGLDDSRYTVPIVVPTGYAADGEPDSSPAPRFPVESVFFENSFAPDNGHRRPKAVLGTNPKGSTLLAREQIVAGDLIIAETVRKATVEPTEYSIERKAGLHLHAETILRYSCHSFEPNARVIFSEDEDEWVGLEAVADIEEGAEILWDYHTTETRMAAPFEDTETGRVVTGVDA